MIEWIAAHFVLAMTDLTLSLRRSETTEAIHFHMIEWIASLTLAMTGSKHYVIAKERSD